MKKYILCLLFVFMLSMTGFLYSKPAVSCLVSCNNLFISVDEDLYEVEGLGLISCGNNNQFCEFYTLLTVWVYLENGSLSYVNSFCSGGALNCGVSNYPIMHYPIVLQPGYQYVVVFSVYDINKGCGTCNNPIACNPTCSINKNIDLR